MVSVFQYMCVFGNIERQDNNIVHFTLNALNWLSWINGISSFSSKHFSIEYQI